MTSSRLSVADVAGEVPRIAARAVLANLFFWARDCGRVCDVLLILQVNGKKTCGKTSSMPLLGSAISLAVWSRVSREPRSHNKIYRPRDIISGHIPREPILNLEYAQIPNQ